MNGERDTQYTKEITCPCCGYEFSDSWEYNRGGENEHEVDCGSCGEKFLLSVDINVTYSTRKVPCDQKKEAHVWAPEIEYHQVTQEMCDRWAKDSTPSLKGSKPHDWWKRTCSKCGTEEYSKQAEPGGPCAWRSDESRKED